MEESSLGMMLDIINRRLMDQSLSDDVIKLRIEQAEHGERELSRIEVGGGVGIMPIYGPIFPKANLMTEVSGATNLQNVRADLQSLLSDDKVKTIIMDIDSPGGSANMIEETGDLIREAREQKPIIAVANTDANSGAFWLGSQASEFYATPSGKFGSIGVYTVHEDKSQQNERDGRKVTYISAGKFKTAGNPDEPLTGEAREYIQEHVDETMDKFVGAVSEGRRLDKESVMPFADGRIFSADKALSMGMIDGVKSLDAVVDGTLAENYTPRIRSTLQGAMTKHRQSVDMLKAEHADIEHSEPGTGSPPERRTDNDIPEDDMYRRDQPPIIQELEEEGSMEEFLKQLRESLGLKVDASETEVAEAWASNVSRVATALGVEVKQGEPVAFSTVVTSAEEVNKQLEPLRRQIRKLGSVRHSGNSILKSLHVCRSWKLPILRTRLRRSLIVTIASLHLIRKTSPQTKRRLAGLVPWFSMTLRNLTRLSLLSLSRIWSFRAFSIISRLMVLSSMASVVLRERLNLV